MPRIIDVIDHVNVADDELVYREPQRGSGDWRLGSQVIVGPSQVAVFIRGGEVLGSLGTGRHTISTGNLPLLSTIIGLGTSGRTPFTADLYFINLRDMPQVGWGTVKPIYLRTDTGLGILTLRTHGVMEISVSDPVVFLNKYAINKPVTRMRDVKTRIQAMLLGELNSLLLQSGAKSIDEANAILEDIEGASLVKLSDKFAEIGMQIKAFEAFPFDNVTVPIEELRDLVPLELWLEVLERQKRLDIGMAAAQNEGMGGSMAAAGIGMGVGQQMGGMMAQPAQPSADVSALQQQMQQQQMMMQQMMMQMMNQNQPGGAAPAAPQQQAAVANPQTKEEIQALIDNLDVKLMAGEISEAIYNRLVAKWQQKLDELG
jgi:membrane protease subunit (stomatin/prohibitin family)